MNLDKLLQKSRDIARLNTELSLKLKENQEMVSDVEKEINFFRQKIEDAEKSKSEISVLRKNLDNINEQNRRLYRNIELLKQDLLLRNNHLNILRKRVVEMKQLPSEIRKKEEEKILQENEVLKLKNNIKILKRDLSEKDKHLNVLRRAIIDIKEKKQGNLRTRIVSLEEENNSIRKKLEEIKEKEARIKENQERETKMLLIISKKLRNEMSEKEKLSRSVLRLDQVEEENRKFSSLLRASMKELNEKKEKVNILDTELANKESFFDKSSKALGKMKRGLELSIKRNRELEKNKTILNKRVSDLQTELESAKKDMETKEKDFNNMIEDERNKHKTLLTKFIRQYSRSKLYSESEIKEQKEKIRKQGEEKSFLLEKIEFLKKIIAESTKKGLDTRAELEILKKKS